FAALSVHERLEPRDATRSVLRRQQLRRRVIVMQDRECEATIRTGRGGRRRSCSYDQHHQRHEGSNFREHAISFHELCLESTTGLLSARTGANKHPSGMPIPCLSPGTPIGVSEQDSEALELPYYVRKAV